MSGLISFPFKNAVMSVALIDFVLVIEDSETKKQYLALDKDDEQTYKKKVQEMLPELLMQDKLQAGEIGIAKLVTDPKSVYPALALLKGEDIVEKRTKNKVLSVNGTVVEMVKKRDYSNARYRPTGLYAPPGDIITLTIPKDLVNKIGVLIGQDTINQIKFMPLLCLAKTPMMTGTK